MAHRFEIRQNKAGEYVAYFCHNSETMFWTEGYSSKAGAKNAIESLKKNGPAAEIVDTTSG
ncbi:YegP family protein [Novosphingobium sp. BL-52-GroH]|uniref:YegP family protein n=1 Tax=Novosphingobium sp. BL-52-GroH TaxID=3349877 RepID=UPI00384C2A4D